MLSRGILRALVSNMKIEDTQGRHTLGNRRLGGSSPTWSQGVLRASRGSSEIFQASLGSWWCARGGPAGFWVVLGEPRGGVWHVFSGAGIDVEHEKKVDLGVLGGADCHGLVADAPFPIVDGLYVKFTSSPR